MIVDARKITSGAELYCDICIVGSGAAGMTIAHELCNSGLDVMLLEAGGRNFSDRAQEPYRGDVVDRAHHGALEDYRHRRLGGTTAVWGGRCAPFTAIDFERREHVPYSGWPISLSDMDPFYARANQYCQAGVYDYQGETALPAPEAIPHFNSDEVDSKGIWRFSPPTDFGRVYGPAVSESANVTIVLHANCLRLQSASDGSSIDYVEAASAPSRTFRVRATRVVLACGGLEAVRVMLASNDVHPNGIGNQYGLVGRFYISHMTGDAGEVEVPCGTRALWDYQRDSDGVYCRRALTISRKTQHREGLLNFRAIFSHPSAADPGHGSSVLSAMYLVKRLIARRIPPEYSRALSGMSPLEHIAAHSKNILLGAPSLASFALGWSHKRVFASRKLPSVVLPSRSGIYTLHYDAEQRPNPESRVSLCETRDSFGVQRLKVDWRFTPEDIASVVRSCRLIGDELQRTATGRLLFDPETAAERLAANSGVGSHHIGATRMAASPRDGVVDSDCRVHGVRNLYIASSSTFPTSGFANPTLTIVAFAVRIADHLRAPGSVDRIPIEVGAVDAC